MWCHLLHTFFFGPDTKGRALQSPDIKGRALQSLEPVCYDEDTEDSMFSGANDLVVVEESDGQTLKGATPFQLRIGKKANWRRDGKKGFLFVKNKRVTFNNVEFVLNSVGQLMIQREGTKNSCFFTPQELGHMDLTDGRNEAKIFFDDFDYTQKFNIYRYSQNKKLIITDIDGTITKTDLVGLVCKTLKWGYHHEGVVKFFDEVSKRGYVVIYLTANTLCSDDMTHTYLFSVLQNRNGHSLPRSPVLMSPMTLNKAIRANSEAKTKMKRARVTSLMELFESNPADVVAGAYGNKPGDTKAYQGANIQDDKIFIINPQSDITNQGNREHTTYEEQSQKEWLDKNYPEY